MLHWQVGIALEVRGPGAGSGAAFVMAAKELQASILAGSQVRHQLQSGAGPLTVQVITHSQCMSQSPAHLCIGELPCRLCVKKTLSVLSPACLHQAPPDLSLVEHASEADLSHWVFRQPRPLSNKPQEVSPS